MILDNTLIGAISLLLAATAVGLFAAALATPTGRKPRGPHSPPDEETERFGTTLAPAARSPLELRMASAGFEGRGSAAWFFVLQVGLALLLPLALLAAFGAFSMPSLGRNLFGIGAALLGFGLPRWFLGARIEARRARMRRALPDFADLVVTCLEGGLGLQAALRTTTGEMRREAPALSSEIGRLLDAWTMGGDRALPVDALLGRTGVVELAELGRSIEEAERSHSDVTETLRRFAKQERGAEAGRVRSWAKRVPIFVALVQALCVLPAAAAVLVGPALIRAMQELAALLG